MSNTGDEKQFQIGNTGVVINPDNSDETSSLDDSAVFQGAIIGFLIGAIVWFFNLPRRGLITRQVLRDTGDNLRERLEATDPVADSIAEGKALARQRQQSNRANSE